MALEFYPAIQGKLGSWQYYSTTMTARNLATNVRFASEVWDAPALDYWLQRTLDESRAQKQIASYLARHEDRFFNAIVVAAIEGNPAFFPVSIEDDPQFTLIGDDRLLGAFGALRFDGSQKYYALDGQHRLRGIQALLNGETPHRIPPGFEDEQFPVIIVVQRQDESREEFLKKYRRLFGHLNRYAKPMDNATTIIMEEDDAFAICTRRLIQEHPFFAYTWPTGEEDTRIRAKKPKPVRRDEMCWTSIEALYQMNIELLMAYHRQTSGEWSSETTWNKIVGEFRTRRPEDEVLDSLTAELTLYWNAILEELPVLENDPRRWRADVSADVDEGDGLTTNHLLFRPIGQELFCRLVRAKLDGVLETPSKPTARGVRDSLRGFASLEWRLHSAPWRHLLFVYDPATDRWSIRSEDRKKAAAIGERIMRFVLGIDAHDQDAIENLEKSWRSVLLNCPDEEADALWRQILQQSDAYADMATE